jgi:hypothetical protein
LSTDGQLNLFEQINPAPSAIAPETLSVDYPFQHLNGHEGVIVGLMPDAISVRVEGIAVALMFRPEALEKWTPIGEYTAASAEAEAVVLFREGDRVECHTAFIGHIGTVSRVGMHCGVPVAWVNYGKGKPLYPCSLEQLTQVD